MRMREILLFQLLMKEWLQDERNLVVTITEEGEKLKDMAIDIPAEMGACVRLSKEEAKLLYDLLYKIIGNIR